MKRNDTLIAFQRGLGDACRTLLAIVFLFSGAVKAVDPLGTTYKIDDYLKAFGGWFTDLLPFAFAAALCLIAVEFVLGFCMLLNVRTSWTSWLSLLFYLVMTPLTLYIALNNPVSDCGCFGDAVILTNWQTFGKNVILLTLTLVLLWCSKHMRPLWLPWIEAAWAAIGLILVSAFMAYNLRHLPIWDFRPYKVGNYLPALMEMPEDAEPDQYEISFVYEKDGSEQEFTLDNYPKNDSTWTFVRQNSRLIKKGYEPPIHDFEILTMDYEDITYDILESDSPVTLVILYDLKKMDRSQLDKLRYIHHQHPQVYFLTGSGEDDIIAFTEELGWDEELMLSTFCYVDPVTLKTIVRANPGVVILQNGTVVEKHNMRQWK